MSLQVAALVNNAAVMRYDWTKDSFDTSYATNFEGPLQLTEKVAPHIKPGQFLQCLQCSQSSPEMLSIITNTSSAHNQQDSSCIQADAACAENVDLALIWMHSLLPVSCQVEVSCPGRSKAATLMEPLGSAEHSLGGTEVSTVHAMLQISAWSKDMCSNCCDTITTGAVNQRP